MWLFYVLSAEDDAPAILLTTRLNFVIINSLGKIKSGRISIL